MALFFEIKSFDVERVRVPLKAPFVTALGKKTHTENVRLRLRLGGGAEGVAEASSSVVQAHFSPGRLEAGLRRLARRAAGEDVRRSRRLAAEAFARAGEATATAAAFECAVLDALTQALGVPLWRWLGGRTQEVMTDLTISAWPAEQSRLAAAAAARDGFRTLKVKVGSSEGPAADLRRVLACAAAKPKPAILLDGNQGLSRTSALRLVRGCLAGGARVQLFEQPLPREDLDGLRRLSRDCPVPIAADESARTPAEALEVLRSGAARALNVKVAKTGIAASLEIIALAKAAGAPLMIGCMQETSLGLSAGAGAFRWADLDSDVLLAETRPEGRYRRDGPRVSVA